VAILSIVLVLDRGKIMIKVVVAIGTRLDTAAAGLQIDIRLMGWA